MKKACVIGLGNIFRGDLGIGCYVVDALGQDPLGDAVELSYLAEGSHYADAYVYGAKLAIIVQALSLGGVAGGVYRWDMAAFWRNISWLAQTSESMRLLARALGRMEFFDTAPKDLMFVWIEPKVTEGFGISEEARKALRRATGIIKEILVGRGFLPAPVLRLSPIYRLHVLGTTA